MYEIAITDSQDIIPLDTSMLRDVTQKTLSEEGVASAVISLAFVDNETIRNLNRQYLNHDYDTDVLSFLLECDVAAGGDATPQDTSQPGPRGLGKRIEGEVVISAETAVLAAAQYAWSPRNEIMLYLVHGLLHLAGYDDCSESEKRVMRSREREILRLFNLVPRYHEPENFDSDEPRTVSEETVSIDESSGADS
ncbi:MAG: rRNA maturation RNase YbeY [Planctomycetes bacterium]|nr:rRNA maturation RNase YbeY [Planctomycetota bacterium]